MNFVKKHKWWFIGGGILLIFYWLYKRGTFSGSSSSTTIADNLPGFVYTGAGAGSGGGGGGFNINAISPSGQPHSFPYAVVQPIDLTTPSSTSGPTTTNMPTAAASGVPTYTAQAQEFNPTTYAQSNGVKYTPSTFDVTPQGLAPRTDYAQTLDPLNIQNTPTINAPGPGGTTIPLQTFEFQLQRTVASIEQNPQQFSSSTAAVASLANLAHDSAYDPASQNTQLLSSYQSQLMTFLTNRGNDLAKAYPNANPADLASYRPATTTVQ